MSNIVTDKIKPDEASADKLTIGGTGDSVVVLDSLNLNTLQDAGGNNIFVSNGSGTVTSKNSGLSGALNLISTQTASDASSVSFTSGLDSTYDVYVFKFADMNPVTDGVEISFQVSSSGGAPYAMTITSTWFRAYHFEDGTSGSGLGYVDAGDQAQGTSYQRMIDVIGSASDENASGELHLFAPSSTTYVKHFYGKFNCTGSSTQSQNAYFAGYINDTNDVDAIDFKMSSGNFDGTIKMYGISKS